MMIDSLDFLTVLRHYPAWLRGAEVDAQPVEGGFSGARIYRVRCGGGEFGLRAWPPGSLPRARMAGLHRLLRFVFGRGVTQVPVPVMSARGETLVDAGGRLWQLEPWLPGRADFHQFPTTPRLQAAVRCLARWHLAAEAFEPSADERTWFSRHHSAPSPAVVERLELIREWRSGKRDQLRQAMCREADGEWHALAERIAGAFDRAVNSVADQLLAASRVPVTLQPCLRDVWHDHLLFTGNEVTGLIDASACRTECVAADLSRLLGSLVGDDWPAWQVALDEYRRHRPLTAEEFGLVPVLDRSGVLLSGMTWLDRLFLQGRRVPPIPPVIRRMRAIADRLERL